VILALERVQWSFKHDLIVPGLVIVGLWLAGAVYYTQHTYAGGAISTPEQAIEAARHSPCIAQTDELAKSDSWHADLTGDLWIAHKQVYRIPLFRLNLEGFADVEFDAKTGRIITCRTGAVD